MNQVLLIYGWIFLQNAAAVLIQWSHLRFDSCSGPFTHAGQEERPTHCTANKQCILEGSLSPIKRGCLHRGLVLWKPCSCPTSQRPCIPAIFHKEILASLLLGRPKAKVIVKSRRFLCCCMRSSPPPRHSQSVVQTSMTKASLPRRRACP